MPYEQKTGWFPDLVDEGERNEQWPWAAFIQLKSECHRLNGVWFATEDDCWDFIRTRLVGQGTLD